MDCTQILDDFAFDEPKEIKEDKKIQYGSLQIGDKSYPVYKGENRIGRDAEACSVVIDSKALSKEHAVIDVADYDNHHLYDLSSTNKTRMGKLVLQPYIRYNIQDQATIMFADISATYHKCDINEIAAADDSKSPSIEDLEDTVNDLDTQMECHYEDEKLKSTVMNNSIVDNIYDAPTQCEDLENETLKETGKDLTSLTTSVTLLSNDTNENKSVSHETESSTVFQDQSYDRSLLEGDEDMFQISTSGSGDAEKGKTEGIKPTCNQQEEKKKSKCQQSDSALVNTAVQSSESCIQKSFTLDLSSGDETDPEDIFCAQTQQFPVLKKKLETTHSTEDTKNLNATVDKEKKTETININLMPDTLVNEQRMEQNCPQSNFSKHSVENSVSTSPQQENEKKLDLDSANKEVASGDETDPEELFCAPTQKFCVNKGKSSTDKTDESDPEDLYGAPTQNFESIDSKKVCDGLVNIPQTETNCQRPKLLHTTPKQMELNTCKQSELINEMETDLSDTTLEDVICPGTQESRRMATEMEINETPERDVVFKGHTGRKSLVEEDSNAADVLKKQKNENDGRQSDMDVDELFLAPTQKIENFSDLNKVNKTNRTNRNSEEGECEKQAIFVAEDKGTQPPELLKETLQSDVLKVATKQNVCSDVYSQPTQKLGDWNEEQEFQGNVGSKCNRSKINLENEMNLQELFSQPTQKFCGSSTNYEIKSKQTTYVQKTDVEKLSKGATKETYKNKSANASPSVLVFENVRETSSDVCDIAHITETNDTDDIFSCLTQKLDAGLTEKNETGVAVQKPTVCNKNEKDIFSADTQDFLPKTVGPLKTESERILNSMRMSGSKATDLQHSARGGVDGPDDSLSGEDEEVIKIFSKDVVHQKDSNCVSAKHTKNTTEHDNECISAECREKDEDSLEMQLQLPQTQEVIAAFEELENKETLKTFSSPVIPRKRKGKAVGERKLNTVQESPLSENIKPLPDTPKSASNSNEKRKVSRQSKDGDTKKNHEVHAVHSASTPSSSEEKSKPNINPLPSSKDSGSRRSVRERKKTWKLAETTDSSFSGQNNTYLEKISERKLHENSPERPVGKRQSRLKKAVASVECNSAPDSEIKSDSKKSLIKNINTESNKSSVSSDNQQEKNQCGSASKNLRVSNQEQTVNCDKNESSLSVDFQQSECKTASKIEEPLQESKKASVRKRGSRITDIGKVSEEIKLQGEDQIQNSTKSRSTRLRNPNRDKANSSDESCQEVENTGLKSRKSKLSGRVSTSEDSVKSINHKQVTSKLVTEKINHNEDEDPHVRLPDHQKKSRNNVVPIPQMGQKGDAYVIPGDVEESSNAGKRTSKRKLDKTSSHRSHNTKDGNQRSVSPIDNVDKELKQNIYLDTDDATEAQPPNKKRKVTQSNVEKNEPPRKDKKEENTSKTEELDIKIDRMSRGRKTGTEQSKNKNTKNGTDSPKSQEYKNVPASTRKRRAVSEKITNTVSANELQNLNIAQDKLISDHGKTTKCDTPVKKPKTSLPLPPKEPINSHQHKGSCDNSPENNEKSPRASHRLSTRPAKTTHQVLFTGLNDPRLQTTVQNLGGKVMEKPEDCNVLVTDKVRRTYKFLCMMGRGKPIVSPDWLLKSQKSGRFLDPWEFLLNDKENETKFKFSLKKSLMQCEKAKLLTGFSVAVTPNVKPPPQEMKGIVESCGGTFIEVTKKFPENSFIVSCNEDKHMWSKLKKLGPPVVGAEVLLLGVLQQKLNLNTYILK